MVVMYIFFLGVVPIAAIIFLCWYFFLRDQHQRSITWAKIHRLTGAPSKASLPCVNFPSQSIPCTPSPSVATPLLPYHKESMQKSDVPDNLTPGVPQVTIQSSPKTTLKTFGVASELLIVQKVEISPSVARRSKSDTPGESGTGSGTESGPQRGKRLKDIRTWMKDRLHLQIPSLKRSFSNSNTSTPSSSTSMLSFSTPLSSPLSPPSLLNPPPPPPSQSTKTTLTPQSPPLRSVKPSALTLKSVNKMTVPPPSPPR